MTVLGDFRLIKKLGQGAMATVYKARQISFDRKVALKLLNKSIADNPKLVERFYREARVMGELDHPNIVQGYGVGEIDGIHYFAMEYVSGKTLQQWLGVLGWLTVGDALAITLACARALEYAHAHGLVHRDIKPENVLITRQGEIKVADLGMVKMQDEDMSLTQTGHAVGTPWYMPLEQARNAKDVDGRCDIYALGCTLYCMLTGRPPFTGNNIVEVIQAKERGTFPSVRQVNPNVPERLELIIGKMTAKLPQHRYQNCADLIHDLESLELASPTLTFLNNLEDYGRATSTDTQPVGKGTEPDGDIWFVKVANGRGGLHSYTAAEIIDLVESGRLKLSTPASRSRKAGFRALASFREFQHLAQSLATQRQVSRKKRSYEELYREIEEHDRLRERADEKASQVDELITRAVRLTVIITLATLGGLFQLLILINLVRA